MTEEEKDFDQLIDRMKTAYPTMTPGPRGAVDLNGFSIFEKGEGYKYSYCWELGPNFYLFSLYNSYRVYTVSIAIRQTYMRTFKYLYCYLDLGTDWPDTILRPNNTAERLANLITRNHTGIPHNKEFNKKYLIESVDPNAFIGKITDELLEDIQNFDELYLEIRGNRCLLLHLRAANYDDTMALIKIANGLNPHLS